MAKVLERLQMSASSSTPGREDWRVRDVVRTLEEQLVKERAKSQRSANKRCQEQRLLMEQVALYCCSIVNKGIFVVFSHDYIFFLLFSRLVWGAEGLRVCSPCSCQESHQWTGVATERVRQSNHVLYLFFLSSIYSLTMWTKHYQPESVLSILSLHLIFVSTAEWLPCLVTSALELMVKSIAPCPVRGGQVTGQSELVQGPGNG